LKPRIVGQELESAQLIEINNPAISDGLGDGTRERRVGQ